MNILYPIFIFLFRIGIFIASGFHAKARKFYSGRKSWSTLLASKAATWKSSPPRPVAWFHCASLGEFEMARPLIELMRGSHRIVVTFFSPSGYEIRKDFEMADWVGYLPVDTRSNAREFIRILNPERVYFIKYDFWKNFLCELKRSGVPTYLVSARFRKDQFKGIYGHYLRGVLKCFFRIFTVDIQSADLLRSHGIINCEQAGDLRFDRVAQVVKTPKKLMLFEHFAKGASLIVGGSTWGPEEELISGIRDNFPGYKWVIAPHDVSAGHIARIRDLFKGALLYSEISREPVSSALPKLEISRVLIVDSIGWLSSIYQYGQLAVIGGGFGSGLHNILEAVGFGLPVVFGPRYDKFPEAAELIAQGGAFSVTGRDEMEKAVRLITSDTRISQMAAMVCKNYLRQRTGAAEIVFRESMKRQGG